MTPTPSLNGSGATPPNLAELSETLVLPVVRFTTAATVTSRNHADRFNAFFFEASSPLTNRVGNYLKLAGHFIDGFTVGREQQGLGLEHRSVRESGRA
jgi:hypothetical protein